jgi:pyruvate/2-oxoglutarate dehydrogenase complex dihydrolipoamide acyltransferase (E2) component
LMLHVPPIGQGLGKGPVIEWLKQKFFRMSRNQS